VANEADIDSEYIGSIQIFDNFSTIDLPNEKYHFILKTLASYCFCLRYFACDLIFYRYDLLKTSCDQTCALYCPLFYPKVSLLLLLLDYPQNMGYTQQWLLLLLPPYSAHHYT
jgi:hypothetical protein